MAGTQSDYGAFGSLLSGIGGAVWDAGKDANTQIQRRLQRVGYDTSQGASYFDALTRPNAPAASDGSSSSAAGYNYQDQLGPGNLAGAQEFRQQAVTQPTQQPTYNTPAPSGGGGSQGPENLNPAQRNEWAISKGFDGWDQYLDSLGAGQKDVNREIDNIFSEVNSYLGNAENNLRSGFDSLGQDIAGQFDLNTQQLQTQADQAGRTIDEQEIAAQQRQQEAQNANARLFNDLARGAQQRFGGATSAGQAATELANVEMQRNSAQVAQQFGQAQRELESEALRVQEQLANGMQQLRFQKDQAMNEARREYNNKLLEISSKRAEAAQNKGAMKLEALQNLRNQIFQINMQATQFEQQLEAARQQMAMELQGRQAQLSQAAQNALGAGQAFTANTSTNPQTQVGVSTMGGGTTNPALTGSIRDEEMFGRIGPQSNERDNYFGSIYGSQPQNIRGIPNGVFNRYGEQIGSSEGYVQSR